MLGAPQHFENKIVGNLDAQSLQSLPKNLLEHLQKPEVVRVYTQPSRTTACERFYEFDDEVNKNIDKEEAPGGFDLRSGEEIIILVQGGEALHLEDLMLGHRKRKKYWPPGMTKEQPLGTYTDADGAYTEVEVFDAKTQKWYKWQDPLGNEPVKFAEPRLSIENEKLGCWFGMVGDLRPQAIRLISRGQGDNKRNLVTEHYLTVITRPEITPQTKDDLYREYTKGNRFADFSGPAKGPKSKPLYGGGKDNRPTSICAHPGAYPNAVPLRAPRGCEHFPLNLKGEPDNLDTEGCLHVKLPAGIKLKSLEVSAGCKWTNKPVGNPPKTIGVPGGHKLFVALVNGGQEKDMIIKKANVGSEGVIIGGMTNSNYITQQGDELVFKCPAGTIYVMGWRVLYEDATTSPPAVAQKTGGQVAAVLKVTPALNGNLKVKMVAGGPPEAKPIVVAIKTPPSPETHQKQKVAFIPVLNNILSPTGQKAGTQGGEWHKDSATNERYFVKGYENHQQSADRCATELIANAIYCRMGVPVPEVYKYGNKIASREIANVHLFSNSTASPQQYFGNNKDIKDGFIVDAWLANWDVFGLHYDNILISNQSGGKMHRNDFGGALFFRATGAPKPEFAYEKVTEIETMRNPAKAQQAGAIFQQCVTENDIKAQVQKLSATMTDEVITGIVEASGISNAKAVCSALIKRRNWLAEKYK